MTMTHAAKVLFGKALQLFHAGEGKLAGRNVGIAHVGMIHMTSTAFADGERMERRFSGEGDNVSPPLSWFGVPAQTKELVLLCEDPDAPMAQPFLHWMARGISPQTTSLPEGVPAVDRPGVGQMRQGENGKGNIGYFGPMPPPGHGLHHYHFELFALDTMLEPGVKLERDALKKAMAGHVIAEGEIVGTYERH